ncbi:MAG: prepilin peptidase [Candidatus Rokubacteria bacterium]|nr:prepilin peptidase [Candidatus Rokubacteria bacterium]
MSGGLTTTAGLAVVVAFGLVIGSFLNVVIARVPAGENVWRPRSRCPGCGAPIAWHDNVPLLSFAVLRGKCRACEMPIPWRYPLVEASTAGLLAVAYLALGPTTDFALAVILLPMLLAIAAIDFVHQTIPDVLTIPGTVTGLVVNLATSHVTWFDAVLGIVLGGGLFFVIILASGGGMGGGDMKLGAMLGAFLGWKIALLSIFIAVILGGVIAIALLATGVRKRKDPIPFGPFLAAGGAVGLIWGERMVTWYLRGFVG